MDLSIIIVNWNTSKLLTECLDSIYRAAPRLVFEIIVVDNGSTDDSVSLTNELFPDVHLLVNNRNLGFAKANNQGIKVAKGRFVLLLNSDTLVKPGTLDELIQIADSYPEVGAIGPRLLNMDGTLQESWANFPTFWSELFGKQIRDRHPVPDLPFVYEVDWVVGACLLVRPETMADVGLLDESYFFYSEEVDWCHRIKKGGWKIWYMSNAEVYHIWGGSSQGLSLVKMGLLYQNKLRYFEKFHGATKATLLRYGLALAYSFGFMRRIFHFNRDCKDEYKTRLQVQAQLIWCLLRNKFPEN